MRRLVLWQAGCVFAAGLGAATPISAQVRVDLMAGFSSANEASQNLDLGAPRRPIDGFVTAVAAAVHIVGPYSLGTQVTYLHKGFREPNNGTTYDLDIRSLEVPLLVSGTYLKGPARIVVFAGPTWGFRESCTATSNAGGGAVVSNCVDTERGVIVPDHEHGLLVGFGVRYWRLSLTASYDMGSTNIPANSPGADLRNQTLLVMVGVEVLGGRPPP